MKEMETQSISVVLLEFVIGNVKKLVDNPEKVSGSTIVSTKSIFINISVEDSDRGKVIGRKGKTINSLRILATGMKNTHFSGDPRKVFIEVLEDEAKSFKDIKN